MTSEHEKIIEDFLKEKKIEYNTIVQDGINVYSFATKLSSGLTVPITASADEVPDAFSFAVGLFRCPKEETVQALTLINNLNLETSYGAFVLLPVNDSVYYICNLPIPKDPTVSDYAKYLDNIIDVLNNAYPVITETFSAE